MFSICVVATGLAFLFSAARFGLRDFRTKVSVVVLVCLFLSYAVGLGLIYNDPHFIDNGSEEFIEWRFRWSWAIMLAGYWQFAIVPTGLMVYGFLFYKRSRETVAA